MSVSDEEPYQTIFASLKHPIRRRILRMLSKNPMTFSEMLEVLGVSNSFLTYHLENLGELVSKVDDGKYRLSSFGEAAMATLTKVEDIPTTAPHHSLGTGTKKILGRNVAIALGIICILLVAGLGGAIAYYTMTINSKDATINQLNATMANEINTIASLKANITNLTNERNQLQTLLSGNITSYEAQISTLNATIMQLQKWLDGNETLLNQTQADNQNSVNDYTDFLNLDKSEVWVDNETITQPANSYTDIDFFASYAGYVSVNVTSSTTNNTYVETIWSARGINYDNNITVGTNGTATFPVLSNLWFPILKIVNDTFYSINFHIPGHNITIPLSNAPWSNVTIPWINETILITPRRPTLSAGFSVGIEAQGPETIIRIGNTNTVDDATETVTITYYY